MRMVLLLLVAIVVAACTKEAPAPTPEAIPAPPAAEAAPELAPAEPDAAGTPLAGTAWRLVRIQSMDDTAHIPDDPGLYTLAFGADGSMSLQADCNRGSGSWTSEAEGQLQFGLIAATQAMCPPGSLHDVYLAQFPWVRSYVMENGHLFLATMADGSIIEFEPAPSE